MCALILKTIQFSLNILKTIDEISKPFKTKGGGALLSLFGESFANLSWCVLTSRGACYLGSVVDSFINMTGHD